VSSSADEEIPLPGLDADSGFFWTGGAEGELRILRCQDCGHWVHPPVPRCRVCGSAGLRPTAVSGKGTVFSYTVNRQLFLASMPPPYVIAIVELVEQEGLQFTTNIVECDPEAVRIGLPVSVVFEQHGEVWLPKFVPESSQ
jgi:uncharacterized protein